MKATGTPINILPDYKSNNNIVGKFKNKTVQQRRKKRQINLRDKQINIKKKPKKLLDRKIFALKNNILSNKKPKSYASNIENKNLADIYTKCMKTNDNPAINKMLGTFLQGLKQEYSENNLPSDSQKKILYQAYLKMSSHYVSCKTTADSKNFFYNNTQVNIKEFCDLIDYAIETHALLKNNMDDPTYISAQMQQLVGKGCFTKEENNFIYEKCLSIYNQPEPQQVMQKLQKKRQNLLAKDTLNKEDKLQEVDESIANIKLQLDHAKGLTTQKTFIQAVLNKRLTTTYAKLDKMITAHIKKSKSNTNIDSITANIITMLKDDSQNMPNSSNTKIENNQELYNIISTRVKTILNQDSESSC